MKSQDGAGDKGNFNEGFKAFHAAAMGSLEPEAIVELWNLHDEKGFALFHSLSKRREKGVW